MNSPLSESGTKDALELEKLRQELARLKRPFWKDPARLGAIVVFLVSVVGNIFQGINSRDDLNQKQQELDLKTRQWETQRQNLEMQSEELKTKIDAAASEAEAKRAAAQELESVKKDIDMWQSAIFTNKTELLVMQGQLDMYQSQKNQPMVDATTKNIELQKSMIDTKQKELDASIARRLELEKLQQN